MLIWGQKNETFPPFWAQYEFSYKIHKNHFELLFNARHQEVPFQKNVMNRFREKFKVNNSVLK